MPPSFGYGAPPGYEPVEFSLEDAILNTWVDEPGPYLRLDEELSGREAPPPDQS